MTSLYRALQSLRWAPKRYALIATALFIIAAAPVLLSLQDHSFSINENAAVGTVVGTLAPTTDSDGNPLDFTILSGNTSGAFSLDASSGVLKVANAAALNFEVTPSYVLRVRATANKGTSAETYSDIDVRVQLLDVAEAATVSVAAVSGLSENAATLPGSAQSNGSPTTVAFQWSTSPTLAAVDPATLAGAQVLAAGAPATAISLPLAGLTAGTTYYYRLAAKNSTGIVYSEIKSFATYTIPNVVSIQKIGDSPSNATTLNYKVTFSEAVSGVDPADFTLSKNGTATGSISSVQASNATTYQVSLSGASGNGHIRLDFKDDNSVVNTNAVPVGGRNVDDGNYFLGETYQLDNEAPTIIIDGPSYPYTQIGPSTFTVTYSEPCNITLSASDITLIATGTATGTIEVTGTSNSQRTVNIRNITGDGTLKFTVAAGTATDAAGNVAGEAGPSNVVVVDNTAPVGYCPSPIWLQSDLSKCEAYVPVPLPTYDDNNEPGVVVITNNRTGTANASGTYPVGTTTVTWRFQDQSGNYSECSTTITVEDVSAPVVSCPADIIAGTDLTSCGAVVTYEVPYTDNCSGATLQQTAGLASGAVFPLGVTTNVFEITDAKGNKTTCSFTVTIEDNKGPIIVCTDDIVVDSEAGRNGATVTYNAPTATDNCSNDPVAAVLKSGLASGSFFPSGTTTNVYEARDAVGNITTCSFTVTVVDEEAPTIVISDPSVWLTQNGPVTYTVTYYGATNIALTSADIVLNLTGTANATDVTVTGTGHQRTVTLTGISGDGFISINILPGTATDNVNNPAPGAGPSEAFEVDNTAPSVSIASSDVTTLEDTPTSPIAITISDLVTPASELQVSISAADAVLVPAAGLRLNGTGQNRTLVITPGLHRHGGTQISIGVTDKSGKTTTKQFTLTVTAVADAPIVSTQPASGPEDTQIPLSFSAVLVDADGSESITSYQVENVPAGATLSAGTNLGGGLWTLIPAQLAGITILPPLNFVGQFTLRIRATSQESSNSSQTESATKDLVVTVTNENDAPTFSLSSTAIVKQEDFSGDVVINIIDLKDVDTQLTNISFSLSPASVDWVTISINTATGEITLKSVKDKNQLTPFSFTVRANDGSSQNNIAERTFTVQILPVNDAPVVSVESPWAMVEDFAGTETRSVSVVQAPADEAGETITYKISPSPASLSFINLQFSNGTFTATSKENAWGEKELRIRAFDGTDSSNVIYLKVIVIPVDDAPSFEVVAGGVRLLEDFGTATETVVSVAPHSAWESGETYTYRLAPEDHARVKASIDANTGEITFTSVQDANSAAGIPFTLTVSDGSLESSKEFVLVIEPVNDAPYGKVTEVKGPEPIAFEVETEAGVELFPAIYKDVDIEDDDSTEKLEVYRLEGAPAWLSVENGYVDKNNNHLADHNEWMSQLVANPPLSEEGKVYTVRAYVRDQHAEELLNPADVDGDGNPKRYDEFQVKVVCTNALPTVEEEEIVLTMELNKPLADPRPFFIFDDAKTLVDGLPVKVQAIEVDPAMLQSVVIEPIIGVEGGWMIKSVVPAVNQYGETTFRIKIQDYAYCPSDQEDLDENGERKPVYITVKVGIDLKDILDIPNLITPNGDGANDTWNILGLEEFQQHEVRIFDTRGRLIFTSRSYTTGREWDGTLNGAPLPDGTYTYQILFNDGKEKREGRIHIAR